MNFFFLNENLKWELYSIKSFPREDRLFWRALCCCLTHGSHLPFSVETNVSSHHIMPVTRRWLSPTCCVLCIDLDTEKPESVCIYAYC